MLRAYQTKRKKSIIANPSATLPSATLGTGRAGRFPAVFALLLSFVLFSSPARIYADVTPPDPVTSLTALTGSGPEKIRLTWTSPGDDGLTGVLVAGSSYTIQYTTMATFSGWSPTAAQPGHAFRINLATSSVSPYSVRDTYELTGLTLGSTYYIRIWTSEKESNMSAISNGATYYFGLVGYWKLDEGSGAAVMAMLSQNFMEGYGEIR